MCAAHAPEARTASVTGLTGMAGQVGRVLFQTVVGFTLAHFAAQGEPSRGYDIIFMASGGAYLATFLLFCLRLCPTSA